MSHDYDLHPAGWFFGHVTNHGFSDSKGGNPQIFVSFEDEADSSNRITAFLSMTDASIEYTVKKLRACGYVGSELDELWDGQLLAGNRVRYQVLHESYDGKMYAKVGFVNDPDYVGIQRSENARANSSRFNYILTKFPPTEQKKADEAVGGVDAGDPPF